jgi:hypothetical protein
VIRRRLCPSSYNFLGVAIPKKVLWDGFAKKLKIMLLIKPTI